MVYRPVFDICAPAGRTRVLLWKESPIFDLGVYTPICHVSNLFQDPAVPPAVALFRLRRKTSFLASDDGSYVMGIEPFVDGGMAQI
jgi:hypothetical protein